jgi:hypothetical protein
VFPWVRNITCFQNHCIQVNGRSTAALVRKSLMLETRGSSNLVHIVISVCSLKEYCLPLSVFLDEQHHLCAELPHSSEWEKHCSSFKISINVTSKSVLHLVKHGELILNFKGILLTSLCSQEWGSSSLCKIATIKWMVIHCSSSKKIINVRRKSVWHLV